MTTSQHVYNNQFQKFMDKFDIHWQGLFKMVEAFDNGFFYLEDFKRNPFLTHINGNQLKFYDH